MTPVNQIIIDASIITILSSEIVIKSKEITYEEINNRLPYITRSNEQMDYLIDNLEKNEIELVCERKLYK